MKKKNDFHNIKVKINGNYIHEQDKKSKLLTKNPRFSILNEINEENCKKKSEKKKESQKEETSNSNSENLKENPKKLNFSIQKTSPIKFKSNMSKKLPPSKVKFIRY